MAQAVLSFFLPLRRVEKESEQLQSPLLLGNVKKARSFGSRFNSQNTLTILKIRKDNQGHCFSLYLLFFRQTVLNNNNLILCYILSSLNTVVFQVQEVRIKTTKLHMFSKFKKTVHGICDIIKYMQVNRVFLY